MSWPGAGGIMMTRTSRKQIVLALIPPLVALAVQSLLWDYIHPLVWFLFYPAVFFSSWIGGRTGGLLATILSAALVNYFFIPPFYSFWINDPHSVLPVIVFLLMGALFSHVHDRLRLAQKTADEALATVQKDLGKIQAAEVALRTAHDLLESRVQERTRDLQAANHALQESQGRMRAAISEEQQLRTALDAHAIVAITDPRGVITFVNNKFCEIAKYPREELIGQDHRLVNSGHHSPEFFRQLWSTIKRGDVWHGDIKNRARDGSYYWVATTIVPFLDGEGKPRQFVAIRADITERKRAEESQSRLAAIVESSEDAIITKTLAGVITSWNQGAEKIFGYPAAEMIGQPLLTLIPAERVGEEAEILAAVARGESVSHFETVRLRKGGRRIDVSVTISPVRNGAGTIVGVSKVARDITEQLRAREALRLSEAQMKVIIESLQDGLVIAEMDSSLVHWNPAALRIHGFADAAEGAGKLAAIGHLFALHTLPGEVVPLDRWPMSRVLAGETLHGVELRVTRPGTEWRRIFSYTGSLVEYVGGRHLAFLTIADISERKEAEELLLAVAGAEVGIWHADFLTGELKWSDLCKRIFGLPPEAPISPEILGRALSPGDQAQMEQAVRRAMETHGDYDAELAINRPDGARRWVAVKGKGYYSPAGLPQRMEGVVMDITARKDSEAEIKALYADQKQRTALLDAANRELEAFSYSVSHDLRAPLRHITGFMQLLKKDAGPALTATSMRHVEVISGAALRMGQLIDGLLNFSRVGRVGMQKTDVALGDLVAEVMGELRLETQGRDVVWQVTALPVVRADRTLLRQVLVNLLGNAVKFTGTRSRAVIQVDWQDGEQFTFFVRDNGVGFEQAYAHKLFGVFQRLHNTADFEGTGIGLANVQRIILRHGGRVWAEGVEGDGATFYFSLPK